MKDKEKEDKEKRKAMGKILLLMGIGFAIDVTTAIIIYNFGKSSEAKSLGVKHQWKLPGGKELISTAGLVLVTSVMTGVLTGYAEDAIFGKDKQVA